MLAALAPIHQPNPHCLYIPICIMLHINNSHLKSKHFPLMLDSLCFDVERLISSICFYCHRFFHSYCDIISFSFDWSKSLKSALFESYFLHNYSSYRSSFSLLHTENAETNAGQWHVSKFWLSCFEDCKSWPISWSGGSGDKPGGGKLGFWSF